MFGFFFLSSHCSGLYFPVLLVLLYFCVLYPSFVAWGSVVEGPRIDPRSCHLGFFSGSIRQVYVPGVDSASKNDYQDITGGKGGRCVGVTTLPPSCAECLEIWEP